MCLFLHASALGPFRMGISSGKKPRFICLSVGGSGQGVPPVVMGPMMVPIFRLMVSQCEAKWVVWRWVRYVPCLAPVARLGHAPAVCTALSRAVWVWVSY